MQAGRITVPHSVEVGAIRPQARAEKVDEKPETYPRHSGITFYEKKHFDDLVKLVDSRDLKYFEQPFTRFKDTAEEHITFFLIDPSNNILEFKHYFDHRMMY